MSKPVSACVWGSQGTLLFGAGTLGAAAWGTGPGHSAQGSLSAWSGGGIAASALETRTASQSRARPQAPARSVPGGRAEHSISVLTDQRAGDRPGGLSGAEPVGSGRQEMPGPWSGAGSFAAFGKTCGKGPGELEGAGAPCASSGPDRVLCFPHPMCSNPGSPSVLEPLCPAAPPVFPVSPRRAGSGRKRFGSRRLQPGPDAAVTGLHPTAHCPPRGATCHHPRQGRGAHWCDHALLGGASQGKEGLVQAAHPGVPGCARVSMPSFPGGILGGGISDGVTELSASPAPVGCPVAAVLPEARQRV